MKSTVCVCVCEQVRVRARVCVLHISVLLVGYFIFAEK